MIIFLWPDNQVLSKDNHTGTAVIGPNSSMAINEDVSKLYLKEVKKSTEEGAEQWVMQTKEIK